MNILPVAMIQNADSNSVAYCSFEAASKGNWTFSGTVSSDASSPMGVKCYLLTGANITKSGADQREQVYRFLLDQKRQLYADRNTGGQTR
ncbi:MAG: hypothetical protein WDO16_02210 [Bacteroidota bacterium]